MYVFRTITNQFVVSLAAADLISGCVLYHFRLAEMVTRSHANYWKVVCTLRSFFVYICSFGNVWSIGLVAVDRFTYIHFPFKHETLLTEKRVKILLLSVWFYYMVMTLVFMATGHLPEVGEICDIREQTNPNVFSFVVVPHFALPTAITVVLYTKVAHFAIRKAKEMKRVVPSVSFSMPQGVTYVKESHDRGKSQSVVRQQLRVTRMMGVVLGVFLILYIPSIVLKPSPSMLADLPKSIALYGTLAMYYANGWVNTLIYGWQSKEFREAYKKVLKCQ